MTTAGTDLMKKYAVREMMPRCRATTSRQNSDHYKVCWKVDGILVLNKDLAFCLELKWIKSDSFFMNSSGINEQKANLESSLMGLQMSIVVIPKKSQSVISVTFEPRLRLIPTETSWLTISNFRNTPTFDCEKKGWHVTPATPPSENQHDLITLVESKEC